MIDINEFYPAGSAIWKSVDFNKTISESSKNIYKNLEDKKEDEAKYEAEKSTYEIMDKLAEKQAEAITLEKILLNIIDKKIEEKDAEGLLNSLEYKINPSPLKWLLNELKKFGEWIIDAINWLRHLTKLFSFRIKEITVEIGLTPRVTISFIPFESEKAK